MSQALEAWRVITKEASAAANTPDVDVDTLRQAVFNLLRVGTAVVLEYEDYRLRRRKK